MTFDEFDENMTNRQRMLGLMTLGDADAYVQTAVETSGWLSEIQSDVDELRETYAEPVEMTRGQNEWFEHFVDIDDPYVLLESMKFDNLDVKDLMRAWLNPELIKVVG